MICAYLGHDVVGEAGDSAMMCAYLGHHVVGKARDHAHDLTHRAHLQDVLQLVLQDAHGEVALLDAVHDLLFHGVLWHHILCATQQHIV